MSEPSTFEQELSSSEPEGLGILDEDLDAEEFPFSSEEAPPEEQDWQEPQDGVPDAGVVEVRQESSHAGALGLVLGILMTLFGVFLAFTTTFAPGFAQALTVPLEKIASSALPMVVAGMLICGFAILYRRQNALVRAVDESRRMAGRMAPGLDYLVQAQEHHLDRPPASGEELDRVLYLLQTQDEKLKNLTKAIKMYGRPLIEISNQSSETGHELTQLTSKMSSLTAELGNKPTADALADLFRTHRGATTEDLKEMLQGNQGPTTDELRSGVEEVLGNHTDKVLKGIQESTERVAAGVERLLEQKGNSPDDALQEIKRDLTSLGNTLSAVQNSIAQGAGRQPAAAAPAPARSAPAAAPAAPAAASGGGSKGVGGLAHSIAGERKAPSKNVLGAIAKLKQMRN